MEEGMWRRKRNPRYEDCDGECGLCDDGQCGLKEVSHGYLYDRAGHPITRPLTRKSDAFGAVKILVERGDYSDVEADAVRVQIGASKLADPEPNGFVMNPDSEWLSVSHARFRLNDRLVGSPAFSKQAGEESFLKFVSTGEINAEDHDRIATEIGTADLPDERTDADKLLEALKRYREETRRQKTSGAVASILAGIISGKVTFGPL